jgi:hypothetical protein
VNLFKDRVSRCTKSHNRFSNINSNINQQSTDIRAKELPRRPFSSCADPINHHHNHQIHPKQNEFPSSVKIVQNTNITQNRRSLSGLASPIICKRPQTPLNISHGTQFRFVRDATRRSQSLNCRPKCTSKSPSSSSCANVAEKQFYTRETIINLSEPPKIKEEEVVIKKEIKQTKIFVMPPPPPVPIVPEVKLTLITCNRSESSESLVEFETQSKLNINEVIEKHEEKKIEVKKVMKIFIFIV